MKTVGRLLVGCLTVAALVGISILSLVQQQVKLSADTERRLLSLLPADYSAPSTPPSSVPAEGKKEDSQTTCPGLVSWLTEQRGIALIQLPQGSPRKDASLLFFGFLEEDSKVLGQVLSEGDQGSAVQTILLNGHDPRYLSPDPLLHQHNAQLHMAHALLLSSSCTILLSLILPRGANEKGDPAYNWLAPIDVALPARHLRLQRAAKAFTMYEESSFLTDL